MTMMAVLTVIKLACSQVAPATHSQRCEEWFLKCYADQCEYAPRVRCERDVEKCIDQYPEEE